MKVTLYLRFATLVILIIYLLISGETLPTILAALLIFAALIVPMLGKESPTMALCSVGVFLSLLVKPSWFAGMVVLPWVFCFLLREWQNVSVPPHSHSPEPSRLLNIICFIFASVGSSWLLASRYGLTPLGFHEPFVSLTAVHFFFAGYTMTYIVWTIGKHFIFWRDAVSYHLWAHVVGMLLTAVGIWISPTIELGGALTITLNLGIWAVLVLGGCVRKPSAPCRTACAVVALSALSGMTLAALYALQRVIEFVPLSLPFMAITHGVINGLGVVLLGALCCRKLRHTALPILDPMRV